MKPVSTHMEADICVIGAGSGGLSVAAGASQMGAKTVLIEKGEMGGDCLNYGCVPSKALIAAATKAHSQRKCAPFGIQAQEPKVDFAKVQAHVADVIAAIAPHDSQERFEGLGVTVIRAAGRFVAPNEVAAGNARIKARRFVIATGSSPAIPPIPGLDQVPYLTNETLFENTHKPEHLAIIGGGPIGMEMAQAHRRLGAKVTVLELFNVLPKDDPELTKIVIDQLKEDGIEILEQVQTQKFTKSDHGITIHYKKEEKDHQLQVSHVLMATGRQPNITDLNLDAANVAYHKRGITVDARLRTSNKKIFAIGDVASPYQFTHVAGYHAGIVIRNALFRLPAKAETRAVPWVTYTDPELAHVGLTEKDAKEKHGESIRVLTSHMSENDRAQAERRTDGLIKVITDKRGRVLGASLVGVHAGDLIYPWILAVSKSMKISAIASMIAPYPTLGEVGKRAAGSYYTPSLFSKRTQTVVRLLAKLG